MVLQRRRPVDHPETLRASFPASGELQVYQESSCLGFWEMDVQARVSCTRSGPASGSVIQNIGVQSLHALWRAPSQLNLRLRASKVKSSLRRADAGYTGLSHANRRILYSGSPAFEDAEASSREPCIQEHPDFRSLGPASLMLLMAGTYEKAAPPDPPPYNVPLTAQNLKLVPNSPAKVQTPAFDLAPLHLRV